MTVKKSARRNDRGDKGREMPVREDCQLYARVTQMLGNGRVLAACDDGVVRMCKIRGAMRKREWVRAGDTVLIALRSFQDEKADLVFKYDEGEVHRLRRLGELADADAADDLVEDEDELAGVIEFDPGDESAWGRM